MKNLIQKTRQPSPFKFEKAADFFEEFFKLNKDIYSQRSLSKELGWPISYIPDLFKRRKKFTILRAVEFGTYFNLDAVSIEKLIFFAVQDLDIVSQGSLVGLKKLSSSRPNSPTKDTDLLDAKLFIIFECVRWFKGRATAQLIGKLLERQNINLIEIQKYLDLLLLKKLIILRKGLYEVEEGIQLMTDDIPAISSDVELHVQFLDFYRMYFSNKIGPAVYNSAVIHVNRERYEDICSRIMTLRNWILEASEIDQNLDKKQDVRLFQLELSLLPIVSKENSHKLQKLRG